MPYKDQKMNTKSSINSHKRARDIDNKIAEFMGWEANGKKVKSNTLIRNAYIDGGYDQMIRELELWIATLKGLKNG